MTDERLPDITEYQQRFAAFLDDQAEWITRAEGLADKYLELAIRALDDAKESREASPRLADIAEGLERLAAKAESRETAARQWAGDMRDRTATVAQRVGNALRQLALLDELTSTVSADPSLGPDHPTAARLRAAIHALERDASDR